MTYKVFLVEDEVVTREGIRDNVDWQASGFEFCGEAADGEIALPLLRAARPDVLITDIKMPFMDGLQLSKIVRERMPWVKIIILSGHDEFEYAHEAIKLGVTDYLLKPVTVQKLQDALRKLTSLLDEERKEQENIKRLQDQVEESKATLRERLLFKLVVGAITPSEAIETGHSLGLDLIARQYLVLVLKIELKDRSEQYDYTVFQQGLDTVITLAQKNRDIFAIKRDWGDLILLMKGETSEYLEEERDLLLKEIQGEVAKTGYQLAFGLGSTKNRLADINQSYVEALVDLHTPPGENLTALNQVVERAALVKMDKAAIENYLHSGTKEGFTDFFKAYLEPLGDPALKSSLIKTYIFIDVVLNASRLVNELGGEIDKVIPELNAIEMIIAAIKTVEQLQEQTEIIITRALAFRDSHPNDQYKSLVRKAKEYIASHYSDSNLSLNEAATRVNLSPSYFSVIFSQEAGLTFKEYLTEIRITEAKKLLRMTSLRSAEIAYQVGYTDPHYFSAVFKKNTGLSPLEFRAQV